MNEFLPIQLCDLQNNTFTSSAKMMWVNYLQLCLVLATIGSSFFISKKLNQINPSFLQRNIGHKYPLQGINLVDDVDINTLEETKEYMRTVYNQESKVREHLGSISNDDIEVEYLSEGFTNYCFRCYSTSDPSKNVFIKHAKENTKQLSNFKLSSNRLTTEYIASRTFSKYTPSVLPKVLHYNDTSKYLITEFLTDFRTLKEYMIEGVIDVDCCRFMGTVMGRSHARTHEAILNISSITRFRQEFGNLDHFQVWKTNMFDPTMTTLAESEHRVPIKPTSTSRSVEGPQVVEVQEQIVVVESEAEYIEQMLANFKISVETFEEGKLTPLDKQIEESTQSLLDGLNKDGDVTRAVTELQAIYLDKKQVLLYNIKIILFILADCFILIFTL